MNLANLSPEAQVVLIVCTFTLILVLIKDRESLRSAIKGTDTITRAIARMRKQKSLEKLPDPADE